VVQNAISINAFTGAAATIAKNRLPVAIGVENHVDKSEASEVRS